MEIDLWKLFGLPFGSSKAATEQTSEHLKETF